MVCSRAGAFRRDLGCLKLEGGSGASEGFYRGDTFIKGYTPLLVSSPKTGLLLCLYVGRISAVDWEPFPMRSVANALVTAVETKMGQSSGNLCSLRVILQA